MLGDRSSNRDPLPPDHTVKMSTPEPWVRAAVLIRIKSLTQGASGVLLPTLQSLTQLLNKNVIARIPLRGSILACGDLSHLSYIAGLLEGQPKVSAWLTRQDKGTSYLLPSNMALAENSITLVSRNPREALTLANGTSMTAGVAALAMHKALHLTMLSKNLTAMSVEIL